MTSVSLIRAVCRLNSSELARCRTGPKALPGDVYRTHRSGVPMPRADRGNHRLTRRT
jgi:hypothetical protein